MEELVLDDRIFNEKIYGESDPDKNTDDRKEVV
jgi:hypothetical protein